jgi:DNA-binding NarL/FixJ family response regulator
MTKKLSTREEQIVGMMSKGFSNKEIAIQLELDSKTISTYVQRIRIKLGLERNCNAYIIVATFQKINFPTTRQVND